MFIFYNIFSILSILSTLQIIKNKGQKISIGDKIQVDLDH